jgi:hypothetical protein
MHGECPVPGSLSSHACDAVVAERRPVGPTKDVGRDGGEEDLDRGLQLSVVVWRVHRLIVLRVRYREVDGVGVGLAVVPKFGTIWRCAGFSQCKASPEHSRNPIARNRMLAIQ